jgi:hypothetical protein
MPANPERTAAVIPPASQTVRNSSTAYQLTASFSIIFPDVCIRIIDLANQIICDGCFRNKSTSCEHGYV